MGTIHVACTADARYMPYCAAMLQSLFTHHARGEVSVYFLLGPDLPTSARHRLKALADRHGASITLLEIQDSQVAGLPTMARIPQVMWYRILLPELVRDQERVLYLDADTLVMDSLRLLWESDLTDHYLGAVTNVLEPEHRSRYRELGLSPTAGYFNSGVLLMNLVLMRRDHCPSKIMAYARQHGGQLQWPDQDALNVVLGVRRLELHPRWNCMNSLFFFPYSRDVFGLEVVEEAIGRPAILHFEGPDVAKPWHFLNQHPYRELYYRHLRGSGWPAPLQEGLTLKNVATRYLPESVQLPLRKAVRWLRR